MNTEMVINNNKVIVDSNLIELLLADKNFLRVEIDAGGHVLAVFKNATARMYKLLPGKFENSRVKFKDSNKLNVTSDNVIFKKGKSVAEGEKRKALKGAYFQSTKQTKKWKAIISLNGKKKSLGYYTTEEQAHQAYLQAANNLGRV